MIRTEIVVPVPAAHLDERGAIVNVTQWCAERFGVAICHVSVISSQKGSRRAAHWHPADHQLMYLVSGAYKAISQEIDADGRLVPGTRRYQFVDAGDVAYCPPRLAHAYEFLANSVFLNMTVDAREADRFAEHTIRLGGWPWDDGDPGFLIPPWRDA